MIQRLNKENARWVYARHTRLKEIEMSYLFIQKRKCVSWTFFIAVICWLLCLQGCDLARETDIQDDVVNALGTVEQFGEHKGQFVIRPDLTPHIAYIPVSGFTDAYKKPGLRVVFSGSVKPFPSDPVFDASFPLFVVNEIRAISNAK